MSGWYETYGGSAFPSGVADVAPAEGMSLLDFFAAHALAGLLAQGFQHARVGQHSYEYAAQAIAARNKIGDPAYEAAIT